MQVYNFDLAGLLFSCLIPQNIRVIHKEANPYLDLAVLPYAIPRSSAYR